MSDYDSIFDKSIKFDPEKEMLILKVNAMLKQEVLDAIYFDIFEQSKKGIVMLPIFADFAIVPKNTEILVEKESNDD